MKFPSVCPEIPVSDLGAAVAYYRERLGFGVDWVADDIGLAGVSRGGSRMFLSTAAFREGLGLKAPVVLWLNLDNRDEVDALHAEWAKAGAIIAKLPEAKPYKLYEFYAQDPDGNYFRVFYDFGWEEK